MAIGNSTALLTPQPRALTRRSLLKGGLGLAGFVGLTLPAGAGAVEAANDLVTTSYRLSPPGWPKGQRLTITVIADLHAGGPNMGRDRVRQVVDAANELRSDLTVVLGDYFATHYFVTERVPHSVWGAELGRLYAPLGVFSVLGNHDWWYDIDGVRRALDNAGVPIMQNDAVLLGPRGRRFWLAGLGDQIAYRLGPNKFQGVDNLPGTLARIRTEDPVILLVHEPDIFTEVPARVALTLAGHTHGGQIRLPMVPAMWAPSSYGVRFAYGHVVENDRHMIVSGGLGCSIVPMRFGVPPEIVHIELG
jgi:uncharacterized protein